MKGKEKYSETHGSQRDIQVLVNHKARLLDTQIGNCLNKTVKIEWVSPLEKDGYAEYKDSSFLTHLGLKDRITVPLKNFWPKGGPNWDALGTSGDTVFIVEAKANVGELRTNCRAVSPKSKQLIQKSLAETKEKLGVDKNADWTQDFYQYANRISHLYYLRIKNHIDAYLVFVYFLNDCTVNGPSSINEWEKAIGIVYDTLKQKKKHILSQYIIDVFIDVKDW